VRRKNGFTLLEVLAVIVVLAIIAFITVPLVMNAIDNAKRGRLKVVHMESSVQEITMLQKKHLKMRTMLEKH